MEFSKGVVELVHDISIAAAMEKLRPIVGEVERAKRSYGKLLALEGIGVDENPFATGLSSSWRDLSEGWLQKKQGTKKVNWTAQQFYRGLTGDLGREIQQMNTDRIFGETTVSAKTEIVQTDGFYNPRIKRRIDVVFRDTGGRFASQKTYEQKRVKLTIKPFPNIPTKAKALSGFLPLVSEKSREKLKKGDTLRPLIAPFTEWFFQNKIKNVVYQYLRKMK